MNEELTGSEKKLNILIIISTIYHGGAQKVARILANKLAERHNVTVAYCLESGHNQLISGKCSLRKLPEYDKSTGFFATGKRMQEQINELRSIKRELGIEVSLSLGNTSNLINAMSKGDEYVICSERSNPKRSWGRLGFLTKIAYRKADHVIFQSERVRSFYGENIRRKSTVLKNPLPIPAPAAEHREKKIVTMGRLMPQKNHALLIRSFARFHEQFPQYSLHIYGEGELQNSLEQLIDDLKMSEHVFLEGHVMQVHERIRDAEMFVLSSDFEGLSNALLECMSMGIACISTKCEGSTDVIRNGENGLLIDIGDESELAQAMCTMAGDPGLRRKMEQQAMEDLKAFEKDTVVRDWEQLLLRKVRS